MVSQNLVAFDSAALTLVLADGDDLHVHGGPEEKPRWVRTAPARLLAVGAGGGLVTTLDARGVLTWWTGSGEVYSSSTLDDAAFGLATAPDGQACAVLFPDRVVLVERGAASRTLRIEDATAAAFSADGGRVAIGTRTGAVRIVTFAGEPFGEAQVEATVTSLAASPKGSWYLTSGDRVLRLEAQGGEAQRITRAGGYAPDCVAVSTDGSLFAVRLDASITIALSDPPKETVAQLRYPERTITGVAFAPGRVMLVGLDKGDANYADIPREELRRTETFEGRSVNRWMVSVNLDAAAAGPPPTAAPAPSASPASPAPLPRPGPAAWREAPTLPAPEKPVSGGAKSWVLGVLSVALLAAAVWWKVTSDEDRAKEERSRQMQEDISNSVRDSVKKSMKK